MTFNLVSDQYMPFMKPNNILHYLNTNSNHHPVILKNIPKGVNKILSEISSDEEIFKKVAPQYQKALDESGHSYKPQCQHTPT